jgi:hypothetical protein
VINAAEIRARATQLRNHAREYSASAGSPLLSRAYALERLAAELERNGRERRRDRLSLRETRKLPPRRPFGRRCLPL